MYQMQDFFSNVMGNDPRYNYRLLPANFAYSSSEMDPSKWMTLDELNQLRMDEELATKLVAMEKELDAKREEADRILAESLVMAEPKSNDEELARKLAEEERNFELLKARGISEVIRGFIWYR
jgi:hypothetical protein